MGADRRATRTEVPSIAHRRPRRARRVMAYTLQGYSTTGQPAHRPRTLRLERSGLMRAALRERLEKGPGPYGERSGNKDGCVGEPPFAVRVRGRRVSGERCLADDFAGLLRVGTQPFCRAIFSPCLITVRSTRRASGWVSNCKYFCQ